MNRHYKITSTDKGLPPIPSLLRTACVEFPENMFLETSIEMYSKPIIKMQTYKSNLLRIIYE